MMHALRSHWPEYLMEATLLAAFMMSAGLFGTLLDYPGSPVHQAIAEPRYRRVLMGLAMGLTAIALIYSPWGQQSGAHINPAVTLTFWRLGKAAGWDAMFYVFFQFAGGLAGAGVVAVVMGNGFVAPPVAAVATVGAHGPLIAFAAELLISFLTMAVVLIVSNSRASAWTVVVVGGLVVTYIVVEAPLSGFSQNPARTLASAVPSGVWTDIWVYFTAPLVGMFVASEVFLARHGLSAVGCAKLQHDNQRRCIFCEFQRHQLQGAQQTVRASDLVAM